MTNSQLTADQQTAHCWPKNNKQLANSFPNLNRVVLADSCLTVGNLSVDVNRFFWDTELLLQVVAAYRAVDCLSVNFLLTIYRQMADRFLG